MEPTHEQNKLLIPIAIVLAGGLVASAIYFGSGKPYTGSLTGGTQQAAQDAPGVTSEDHIVGRADASVVVVEYSDTECPFCKTFHNTMRQLMSEYSGQVSWVYRHFPISQLHSKAPHEAEATECAAELGGNTAFWKYLNQVFDTTQSNDSLDPMELPKIAGSIGLDVTAFNSCLSSGKYTDKISKSVEEAVRIGARGTPYSVIIKKNGDQVVINGAEPYATVKAKIDAALK
ncbi:DsbA family protein [Candidatus Parcubacteria bacterium]|nr:DsbA family protein [Candidatus Parcubacteria bacterium]